MENKNLKPTDFAELSLITCRALRLELNKLDKDFDQAQIATMYMVLLDHAADIKKDLEKLDEQTRKQFIKDNIVELKKISSTMKKYQKTVKGFYLEM